MLTHTFSKSFFAVLLFWLFAFAAGAQVLKPASWSYDVSKKQVAVGDEVELIFNVRIDRDWYLTLTLTWGQWLRSLNLQSTRLTSW